MVLFLEKNGVFLMGKKIACNLQLQPTSHHFPLPGDAWNLLPCFPAPVGRISCAAARPPRSPETTARAACRSGPRPCQTRHPWCPSGHGRWNHVEPIHGYSMINVQNMESLSASVLVTTWVKFGVEKIHKRPNLSGLVPKTFKNKQNCRVHHAFPRFSP